MRKKITVLSDGGFGTALALTLVDNGHDVIQWGPFPDYIEQMCQTRKNSRFLPGVKLPDSLRFESDIEKAVAQAEVILLASPSQYLRGVLKRFKPFYHPQNHLLINVAKGIENDSLFRMSEVVESVLGKGRYVALSGPSHAEEVSRKVPTVVVSASQDPLDARIIQEIFLAPHFRVYTCSDMIGVELGGSLKNIFAIAAGIIDGMKLGDNPKAALVTRAIAEMSRFGVAFGASYETFSGLSGLGDMIVTCFSGHSRNRHVGEELGRGKAIKDILDAMGMSVAEGVATCKSAYQLAQRKQIQVPIINEMYAILFENKLPEDSMRDLMAREPKSETGV